jgi:hypothetical protein
MEICLLNNTYREQLVFFNKGGTAMKVQVVIPREAKNFLQLNPSFGYIQARDSLKIWIKLSLTSDFQSLCGKFKKGEDDYLIPIQLIASDRMKSDNLEKLPVCFDLRVRVTTNKLRINPKVIDFGLIYQDTGKKVDVAFENCSDLTQYIYFYPYGLR